MAHKFTDKQLLEIKYQRCRRHPYRKWKTKPKPGKVYPTGCPVCMEIWTIKEKEREPDKEEAARIKAANMKRTAGLRKYHEQNPDHNKKVGFQSGKSVEDHTKARELFEIVRSKTRGGSRIVDRLIRIAQLHPDSTKNVKGVSHQQQIAAIRELLARGFGPPLDPNAKEEQNKGITVNVLNLKGTTFNEYQKMVSGEAEVEIKPAGEITFVEKNDE